jgi:parallel beta-helix repeat protein
VAYVRPPLSRAGRVCYPTTPMRTAVVAIVAMWTAAGALPGGAGAAECGGGAPCRCGDVLTASYRLPADLGPCEGGGLVLREDAVLDCDGHTIRGVGAEGGGRTIGLLLEGTEGATVRGCKVTGFHNGIELSRARRSRVVACEVFHNGDPRRHAGYGIHLSQSPGNLVQDCLVRHSADEGIHVGAGSDGNTLAGNRLHDNGRENLYVISARDTRVLRNRAGGAVSANLYLKHAVDSRVEDNVFQHRPVLVRGRASGNVFVDNVFEAGLRFEAHREAPDAVPSANLVRGGRLGGEECLGFLEARDHRVEDVTLDGCRRITARSAGSTAHQLIGVPVEGVGLDLAGGAVLRLIARVRVTVRGPGAAPVAGAALLLRDRLGETHPLPPSDGAGEVVGLVPTHTVNAAGLVTLAPAELSVEAPGFRRASFVLGDPPEPTVTVTLVPSS